MYYVAVYDIGVDRVQKMRKLFRRYLSWVQNSVFEGELTEAQHRALVQEAEALMEPGHDSVIFYEMRDVKYVNRSVLGHDPGEPGRFL